MAERSSDSIQRDIERTRAEMSETIEALERRLSPGELFDEFWGRVKGGETGANVSETIRDHPVPLALMGLGLGWLAIEKATESRTRLPPSDREHHGEGTYARADGRVGPYRGDDVIDADLRYDAPEGLGSRIGEAAGTVKDRVTEMGSEAKDRISSTTDNARDRISELGDDLRHRSDGAGSHGDEHGPGRADRAPHLRASAEDGMRHARRSISRRGSQVERGFRSLLEDYPLALGVVTFGLGLAAGAGVPTTEAEDELMGDAADTLKDEVKRTARETGEHARGIADDAVRAARTEAHSEGMADDLKSKAERVLHAATDTAREKAEDAGLTAEGMKARAREAGEKTAATARHGESAREDGAPQRQSGTPGSFSERSRGTLETPTGTSSADRGLGSSSAPATGTGEHTPDRMSGRPATHPPSVDSDGRRATHDPASTRPGSMRSDVPGGDAGDSR